MFNKLYRSLGWIMYYVWSQCFSNLVGNTANAADVGVSGENSKLTNML